MTSKAETPDDRLRSYLDRSIWLVGTIALVGTCALGVCGYVIGDDRFFVGVGVLYHFLSATLAMINTVYVAWSLGFSFKRDGHKRDTIANPIKLSVAISLMIAFGIVGGCFTGHFPWGR